MAYRGWSWTAPLWDATRALAAEIGVPLAARRPNPFAWDGRTLATLQPPTMVIHDLAHWLVCPPIRRTQPEFGLGGGPDTKLLWIDVRKYDEKRSQDLYDNGVREKHAMDARPDGECAAHAFRMATPRQVQHEETSVCIVNTLLLLELGHAPDYDVGDMGIVYGSGGRWPASVHCALVQKLVRRGVLDGDMRVQWPQRPNPGGRLVPGRFGAFVELVRRARMVDRFAWRSWIWWRYRSRMSRALRQERDLADLMARVVIRR